MTENDTKLKIAEMDSMGWDEESKYEVTASDYDMRDVISAIRFQQKFECIDRPVFINDANHAKIKDKKYFYLRVDNDIILPFDYGQIKKALSDYEAKYADKS